MPLNTGTSFDAGYTRQSERCTPMREGAMKCELFANIHKPTGNACGPTSTQLASRMNKNRYGSRSSTTSSLQKRLAVIRLADTNRCNTCGHEDTLQHRLTQCGVSKLIWCWTRERIAVIIGTTPLDDGHCVQTSTYGPLRVMRL